MKIQAPEMEIIPFSYVCIIPLLHISQNVCDEHNIGKASASRFISSACTHTDTVLYIPYALHNHVNQTLETICIQYNPI